MNINNPMVDFKCGNLQDLTDKIIPFFFDKYKIKEKFRITKTDAK